MPDILILTGPPGAGKVDVALALGDRYDRVAHIDIDVLRRFVMPTGYVPSTRSGPARDRQYRLARRNACSLARNFLEERFGVIITDALGPDSLSLYVDLLCGADTPIHVVQLLPTLATCEERDADRRNSPRPSSAIARDYLKYVEAAESFRGATIDNTSMSVQEAADRVQALTTAGESIVWSPKPA